MMESACSARRGLDAAQLGPEADTTDALRLYLREAVRSPLLNAASHRENCRPAGVSGMAVCAATKKAVRRRTSKAAFAFITI